MGRAVKDARLDKRQSRLKLEVRKEPYWRLVSEGAHLGYYRGGRAGKWVARFRKPGTAVPGAAGSGAADQLHRSSERRLCRRARRVCSGAGRLYRVRLDAHA